MSFGKLLQPDLFLDGSVLKITPDLLHQYQLQALVFDVDETLVPAGVSEASEELHQWAEELKAHFSIWLVSNNVSQSRIGYIARALDLPYIAGALKPSRRKLRQAVKSMGFPENRVGMVGDRLLTDVLAGNRLGMFTILVDPIVDPTVAARKHPIRNMEVLFSQLFGVTLRS